MKKSLVCLFMIVAMILSGCSGNSNTNNNAASTVSENAVGTSATQGIAMGDVTGKNDRDKMYLAMTQVLSEIKGARKDYLGDYFKNNKEVKDYDKWNKRVDELSEKVGNTTATISALQPEQNATTEQKNAFNAQKDATVRFLQTLTTNLAMAKADVQNAKTSDKPLSYLFLNAIKTIKTNGLVDFVNMNHVTEYNGVDFSKYSTKGLSGQLIPKYGVLVMYSPQLNYLDTNNGELTNCIAFFNPWGNDFNLSKLKVVLYENGKEIVGDPDATNSTVSDIQNNLSTSEMPDRTKPNGKIGVKVTSDGQINPHEMVAYVSVFKGISRNMNTVEGRNTTSICIYYGDELIWVGDYDEATDV